MILNKIFKNSLKLKKQLNEFKCKCDLKRHITTVCTSRTQRKYVSEKILGGEDEGIALLTLNNEAGKNTVNMQLLEELSYTVGSLAQNWSLRAVIIQSAIKNIFSSGKKISH